jgi:predicted O-methyltransferase YrrM
MDTTNRTKSKLYLDIEQVKPKSILEHIDEDFYVNDHQQGQRVYTDGNCYEWYYAIGAFFKPKSILEIGVRFGYSLMALAKASNAKVLHGYDTEEYVKGSNEIATNLIRDRISPKAEVKIENLNSQNIQSLNRPYDLISIDGNHSHNGTLHDLYLTKDKCKVVIVDDYDFLGSVTTAVDKFIADNYDAIENWVYIPSFRGTIVIVYKK